MKSLIQWLQKEWIIIRLNRLLKQKRYLDILSITSECLEQDFFHFEFFTFRAWAFLETEQLENARIVVGQAISKFPDHPTFLALHGEVSYQLGDYDSALASLNRALELSQGNLQVEYLLGLTYVAKGESEKASDYFEAVLRYDPTLLQSRLLVMAESYIFQHRKS